jgi:hypothetical protein
MVRVKYVMARTPRVLKRIRLELARSREFPDGSVDHGHEFVAPLDMTGRIDPALWRKYRDSCRACRFWDGDLYIGYLLHQPGGSEHARWVFDYDDTTDVDDEAGHRFGTHVFRAGAYLCIRREDGDMHTFKVVSIVPAT